MRDLQFTTARENNMSDAIEESGYNRSLIDGVKLTFGYLRS